MMIDFTMEELLPLVAKLTEKYTGRESTSVTYETAQQLMGAVLYCIGEAENAGNFKTPAACGDRAENARILYESGQKLVLDKALPEAHVTAVLKYFSGNYKTMILNLSSVVTRNLCGHLLTDRRSTSAKMGRISARNYKTPLRTIQFPLENLL